VSDTMRKGILEVSMYEGAEKELMLGCLASLGKCFLNKCVQQLCSITERRLKSRLSYRGQCCMADGRHVLQASNFRHSQYCWRYCRVLIGLSWYQRPSLDNSRDHWYVLTKYLLFFNDLYPPHCVVALHQGPNCAMLQT
jgi:hypothetical protein